jgi:serine protease Do
MTMGIRARVAIYCIAAGVTGMVIGSRAYHNYTAPPPVVTAAPSTTATPATAAGLLTSFAPIVDKDLPAVVNISSSKVVRSTGGNDIPSFMMDPFFRQFFGDDFGRQRRNPGPQYQRSLGSGVITRADGYILTNNHVIDGATDITVTLLDKREFKAKVIGTDAKTDLGVLKIDAKGLPVLTLADSSKVRVGDIALAMGTPFGLGQTVTMGIISAKGRNGLGIEGYEDFIQTDAAINPGNSGGALVDIRGELIGINTAILTRGGGNQGVGFAVPINLARGVMDQVIEHGKVTRGYMGVGPEDISPAMAKALHLTDMRGVLIADVTPGSPAAQAGIQRGDIVYEINGERVEDSNQLRLRISSTAPGTTVRLKLSHDGADRTVSVKLVEYPSETAGRAGNGAGGGGNPGGNPSNDRRENGGATGALDGVQVEDLNYQYLRDLRLPSSTKGVVVVEVVNGSPAAMAGLQSGDVIQEMDRERISSAADFDRATRRSAGRTVLLLINRGGITRYLAVEPR